MKDMSFEELISYRDDCRDFLESPEINLKYKNGYILAHEELLSRYAALSEQVEELKCKAIKAVKDEEELDGDMPDEIWNQFKEFIEIEDRDGLAEFCRILVRQTKLSIIERMNTSWKGCRG
jgi:hypothetical protein